MTRCRGPGSVNARSAASTRAASVLPTRSPRALSGSSESTVVLKRVRAMPLGRRFAPRVDRQSATRSTRRRLADGAVDNSAVCDVEDHDASLLVVDAVADAVGAPPGAVPIIEGGLEPLHSPRQPPPAAQPVANELTCRRLGGAAMSLGQQRGLMGHDYDDESIERVGSGG